MILLLPQITTDFGEAKHGVTSERRVDSLSSLFFACGDDHTFPISSHLRSCQYEDKDSDDPASDSKNAKSNQACEALEITAYKCLIQSIAT
jgi:hypothetical protein